MTHKRSDAARLGLNILCRTAPKPRLTIRDKRELGSGRCATEAKPSGIYRSHARACYVDEDKHVLAAKLTNRMDDAGQRLGIPLYAVIVQHVAQAGRSEERRVGEEGR